MLAFAGQDSGHLLVEFLDDTALPFAARRLESDPVADVEPGHQRRAPRLRDQLEVFNDQAIEKTQVLLAQMPNRLGSSTSILQYELFIRHHLTCHFLCDEVTDFTGRVAHSAGGQALELVGRDELDRVLDLCRGFFFA
jgi:hypothetical protein